MKISFYASFLSAILLVIATTAGAQTWTGASSNDWFSAGNWSPATVPTSTSAVTIPGSLATYPTLTADVTIAALTMAAGSVLHLNNKNFTANGNASVFSSTIDGGGSFSINNGNSVDIETNTFTTTLNVINYTGLFLFYNNTVTGNTTLKDSSIQNTGNNNISGNLFTGNLNVTHSSASDVMSEGFGTATADHVTGNAIFTLAGAGSMYISYSVPLQVDGNLIVSRTTPGLTHVFNTPGNVLGNMQVSVTGGSLIIGAGGATTSIGNNLNISGTPSSFVMTRVKNLVAGGTIAVSGMTGGVDIENDTVKAIVSVTGYTNLLFFYNNSITGNTTIADGAAQNTGNNNIDGNLITGNLAVTHNSMSDFMNEGYGASLPDHVTGNATFTMAGAGSIYISYSHSLLVDGSLTINRTVAGLTNLYNSPGNVGGNFTLSTVGGSTVIGNSGGPVATVAGTANISGTPSDFSLFFFKNNTTGGSISISGASGTVNIQNDTIKATLSVTGYGNQFFLYNNAVTGNTTIADAVGQNTGNNNIDGNLFTGNLDVTHNSVSDAMSEGFGAGTADHVTGNATFTMPGSGPMYISYSHGILVDGTLTINRTTGGLTNVFNTGGNVTGNFTLTTAGGPTAVGTPGGTVVHVGGTFNLSGTPSTLIMYKMKNATAGGAVSVTGPATYIDIEFDTLIAPLSVTGYTNQFFLYSNSITGNVVVTDAAAQNTSNNNIDGNLITGNLNVTHNSISDILYEGFGTSLRDHVTGNATFTVPGTGPIYISYAHGLLVDGNLNINRTTSGLTNVFNTPGNVAGNFTLATVGGATAIGISSGPVTNVAGTFNVSGTPSTFTMYKMKNMVGGGSLSISGPISYIDIENDTLIAPVSVTGYTNQFFLYNNSITGNTTIVDAASQNTSNNNIDGNLFTGNLDVTHNSLSDIMYEGYGATTPDHVTGNASFTIPGTGPIYLSYTHGLLVDGNLTINRTTGGLTNVFNTPGNVGGNFFCSSAGGATSIGNNSGPVTNIGGTFNLAGGSSTLSMFKMKNTTGGGAVTSIGSGFINIQNDTLISNVSITGYTNQFSFYSNAITGGSLFSDDVNQNTSTNNMDDNLFNGNRTIVHNSASDIMFEGYGGTTGNVIRGRDSLVLTGAGALYIGYAHAPEVDGDFVVNSNSTSGMHFSTGVIFGGSTSGHVKQVNIQKIALPNLVMSKTGSGRLFLDTTVIVTGNLQFNTGIIVDTPNKNLIVISGAAATGASNVSHVIGTVTKAGNNAFTFPVGNGTTLASIGISAPATTLDTIRAAFYKVNPASKGYDTSAAHRAASLQKVSGCEYWDLTHVSGTSSVTVTLQFAAPCGGVSSPSDLRVAHYNGTQWDDLGNGGTTGSFTNGTVTSSSSISSFSPFTLATTNRLLNPLPIYLTDISAHRQSSAAIVEWSATQEGKVQGYEVGRSVNGTDFTKVGYVNSKGHQVPAQYAFTDYPGTSGKIYYRLRVLNLDGSYDWSPIVSVNMGMAGGLSFSPNPANNSIRVTGDDIQEVIVRNLQGREVLRYAAPMPGQQLDISALTTGMYIVQIIAQKESVTLNMMKQ